MKATTGKELRPLHERAADIARHIGRGWSVAPHNGTDRETTKLNGPDSYCIVLERNEHERRIVIKGSYPTDAQRRCYVSYHDNEPRITVAETRPVGEIAKEITRRFLPEYKQVFSKVLDQIRATEEQERKERELMGYLAPIVGLTPYRDDNNTASGFVNGTTHIKITTHYGKCDLKIDEIPTEAAARILEIINEHAPATAER